VCKNNSGSIFHPPCLTVVPLYCTTTTHLLTTTSSCSLCYFPPLAISKHRTAQRQSINQYSQTTKRQSIIDSPTNQSSVNQSSISLVFKARGRPAQPSPAAFTRSSLISHRDRQPGVGRAWSRVENPPKAPPASQPRHYLQGGRERGGCTTARQKHLSQPCCCCRRCWSAQGLLVCLLHHPNLSHVYHQHCLSAGLKTSILPFVHNIPSHQVRGLIIPQWPPLQLPAQCSNNTNNNLPSGRRVNGCPRCPPT